MQISFKLKKHHFLQRKVPLRQQLDPWMSFLFLPTCLWVSKKIRFPLIFRNMIRKFHQWICGSTWGWRIYQSFNTSHFNNIWNQFCFLNQITIFSKSIVCKDSWCTKVYYSFSYQLFYLLNSETCSYSTSTWLNKRKLILVFIYVCSIFSFMSYLINGKIIFICIFRSLNLLFHRANNAE